MTTYTPTDLLNVPMGANDAHASTIREYLASLATAVWHQGENFSGYRPFGNSDWWKELGEAFVLAGFAKLDSDGDFDEDAIDKLVRAALAGLGEAPVAASSTD